MLWFGPAPAALAKSGNANVPSPSKLVDIDRYVGRYYELARYENMFQRDCEGVSADYRKLPDGLIEVFNVCRQGAADGKIKSVHGRAKLVPGSGNAKLRVSFFRPFYGDYWVLALPTDYRWVLVGEPTRRYGWILSRSPQMLPEDLQAAMAQAQTLGYERSAFRLTPQTQTIP
jgi:apolipoprotein D and lipocalin family protein